MRNFIFTALIFYSCSINAALINNDIYTTDDFTNLDWLDLTVTLGMTSNAVRHEISPEWDFDLDDWVPSTFMGGGWRFANEAEAVDLVTRNITSDFGAYIPGSVEANNAENLSNLLGDTYLSGATSSYGLFVTDNNELNLIKIYSSGTIRYTNSFNWSSTGGTAVGKFLVREHISAVPLPSSLLLLLSGIVLLFNYQRRALINASC